MTPNLRPHPAPYRRAIRRDRTFIAPPIHHQSGFTLIELLVVIAIIAILSAIAIPQFALYRQRSYDARSVQDLKNAATGEEAYLIEHDAYVDCIGRTSCESTLPGFVGSDGVVIGMYWGSATHFTGQAYHPQGTRKDLVSAYHWNSANGGLQ